MELVKHYMKKLKTILKYNKIFFILGIIVFIYTFIFTTFIKCESKYKENETFIEGKVLNYSFTKEKISLTISGKEKIIVSYYFKNQEDQKNILNQIHLGDKISLKGQFIKPKKNTIPNTFNYQKYLKNHKIYYLFKASSYNLKKQSNIFYRFKDMLLRRIYRFDNSEYYLAILMGNKSYLEKEEYQIIQNNGVGHLLAISGMHLSFLLGIFNLIFNKLKKIYFFLLKYSFFIFFLFTCSYPSSATRVVIFLVLKDVNNVLGLNFKSIHLLCISLFIMLIINPFYIYDLGFLYSFIITFGIIYNKTKIVGSRFQKSLNLSIITFLYSIPLTIYYNYEINLTSILANIIIVPFFSVLFAFMIFSLIISKFSFITTFLISVFKKLNYFMSLIGVKIVVPKISIIVIILMYVILLLNLKHKKTLFYFLLIVIFTKNSYKINSNFYIYYFDVGQGDSSVLIYPHQKQTIMIDTGGIFLSQSKYKVTENVLKFLKSKGISKLDYLILTHGDYDHMGDAINVIENFKVDKVIFNCGKFNDLEKELIKVLDKKNIKYYSCIEKLNIDNNKLHFLQTKQYNNENDNSCVIYTKLNGYKFMFMGDAEAKKEKDILDKYNISDIDVLKVGHHGSKTSSDKNFIDEIDPKYSVISVGKNNRYVHPNKKVLNNLDGSRIYRTDQDGSIMFKIKKNKLRIETYSP